MSIRIQKRTPFVRSILLIGIVGIVTTAFWFNTKRQLAGVLQSTYIVNAHRYLDDTQEKLYSNALQQFSSTLGIKTKLIFDTSFTPPKHDKNTLFFVIEPTQHTATIIYPPLLKEALPDKEQQTLLIRLSQIAYMPHWHTYLLQYIEDMHTLLSVTYGT